MHWLPRRQDCSLGNKLTDLQLCDSCKWKQDTCSNEHEVCPMPLHKYEAQ